MLEDYLNDLLFSTKLNSDAIKRCSTFADTRIELCKLQTVVDGLLSEVSGLERQTLL